MIRGRATYLIWILSLGLFQGCSTGYAPVTDQSLGARQIGVPVTSQTSATRPAPLPNPGTYRVNRGDTLYSISWRYGLDYREVAGWNNINQRFQIFPGQLLRLTPTPVASVSNRSGSSATQPAAAPAPVAQAPKPKPQSAPAPTSVSGQPNWRWPADGAIIRRFSSKEGGSKGIDIAGQEGSPVIAAADGRVVYAGSGLLGYGNLVIINHNREFLSAYAHNSRILVSENDMVKSGKKIAEMGQTGTDRVQLHFEIRRNGKPVDPMSFLPKR